MNATIDRCRKLLEQFPDNELARFSLGKAYFDAGQFHEAQEQFTIAVTRKSDWMAAQILLAKCELALGNKDAARTVLNTARQLAIQQNHQGPLAETEQLLAQW